MKRPWVYSNSMTSTDVFILTENPGVPNVTPDEGSQATQLTLWPRPKGRINSSKCWALYTTRLTLKSATSLIHLESCWEESVLFTHLLILKCQHVRATANNNPTMTGKDYVRLGTIMNSSQNPAWSHVVYPSETIPGNSTSSDSLFQKQCFISVTINY